MTTDRRAFLRSAATAGAALGLLPATVARAMAIPARHRTGTIMDVEHVVIFMQENRAFDHYFGALNGVRGLGDPRPQRLPGGGSVWRQPSQEHPDGFVVPFHGDASATNAYTVDGSDQGHQAAITIVNGGRYDQWGHTGELHKRMVYYKASDLPFYHALASAFTVCDAYHCSTLTQTYPNRLHLWTGCNGGGKVGGDPEMSNYGEDETPSADMADDKVMAHGPHDWTTYAERLQDAGISWKVYQEHDNYGDNILSVFKPFRPCAKDSELYQRGRSWVSEHKTGPDRTRADGQQLVEAFRADVAADRLPQVSWIVTAEDLSEHPSAEPSKGEHVCAELIKALVDHPDVFAKTVFIVNYDEAGGFYDHMQPPMPPLTAEQGWSSVPVAGEIKTYGPDAEGANKGAHPLGLGIRVPAIVVSPWSRGGFVCSEVFDHTSTLKFLERRFGVREENISDWRRAVCGDLTSAFDFATPNQDWAALTLPATADYMQRVARSKAAPTLKIPAVQAASAQDGPQRGARPLPYALSADARVKDGALWIDLVNAGRAGAVFQVFDNTDRDGPWRFTLAAGEKYAAGHWNKPGLGPYDLTVHGPNGFYRRFAGDVTKVQPLVTVSADARARLVVSLASRHAGLVTAAMDEAYPPMEGVARQVLTLKSRGVVRSTWDLRGSDHWYDLTLTLADDPSFVQRLAGHLETGRISRTDPGIGAMRLDA
ncbi:phosphocholine-specific phospholipase C [Caulobacter sp. RHG1]|uniref:phosphocholine-specific phospholipase C n=1 Tax=Caulobacter sp. (strain RHG1) TaxID=2545762 RepID=UPI001558239A|nr:phospholipase C, phosphocholine-specific [Caulobacter sp. RHG1]NQE60629.1 Phospholipase C [Caulobacter sp. RHG1]